MAEGLSNREIAERVSVSENTVKTHSSRVFDKLGARRRTQAVQLGGAAPDSVRGSAPRRRRPEPSYFRMILPQIAQNHPFV
ncbi:MAG: helix-turn-helix transcriptional regulator [Gemmatimonadetes bacterium]|nr:helix-turn-helix transcriptional regulator [Gemmatimonadota bacterium]